MTRTLKTLRRFAPLLLAGSLVGCTPWGTDDAPSDRSANLWQRTVAGLRGEAKDDLPSGSPLGDRPVIGSVKRIDFTGTETVLGDLGNRTLPQDAFVGRVAELLDAQRLLSAEDWTVRHADAARLALLEPGSESRDLQRSAFVAQVLDRRFGAGRPLWSEWVAAVAGRNDGAIRFVAERRRVLAAIQSGDASVGIGSDLPVHARSTGSPIAVAEAWRIVGIAHRLAGSGEQAIGAWEQGIAGTAGVDPIGASELRLLQSLGAAMIGDEARRATYWIESVSLRGNELRRTPANVEPNFWRSAAMHRPLQLPWPDELRQPLAAWLREHGGCGAPGGLGWTPEPTETLVRAAIGHASLDRDQADQALIDLKEAEASGLGSCSGWLRWGQAVALARLGQAPAATTVLATLVEGNDPELARCARGTLGAQRLAAGGTTQGVPILRKAIDEMPGGNERWILEQSADLALGELMLGDRERGLNRLRQVRQQLIAIGDQHSVARSWWNELQYWEAQEDRNAADEARRQWTLLERQARS